MSLENSMRRLSQAVSDLEKIAAASENDVKARQIDLFGAPISKSDNVAVAKTLDRTIERIEQLLQVG